MSQTSLRTRLIGGLLALFLIAGGLSILDSPSGSLSDASSLAAPALAESESNPRPTPTYVSELAPAVAIGPVSPVLLPATGAAQSTDANPWPKAAGVALALLGGLFIFTALSLRRESAK